VEGAFLLAVAERQAASAIAMAAAA